MTRTKPKLLARLKALHLIDLQSSADSLRNVNITLAKTERTIETQNMALKRSAVSRSQALLQGCLEDWLLDDSQRNSATQNLQILRLHHIDQLALQELATRTYKENRAAHNRLEFAIQKALAEEHVEQLRRNQSRLDDRYAARIHWKANRVHGQMKTS